VLGFEIVHGDNNAAFTSFRVGASFLNLTARPAEQAAKVEVSLQTRETPEQLLKWLSSGIHRRRPYKRRHKSCIR
jgi:hypothetical protein